VTGRLQARSTGREERAAVIIIPKHCPACAAVLVKRRSAAHEPWRLTCSSCGFVHYDNPAPSAAVVIHNERGQILLGRRRHTPFRNYWNIIGGFIEGREHPEESARREVREEAGIEVRLERLLGIFMDRYGRTPEYTLNIIYVGQWAAGEPTAGDDIAEVRWFDPADVPLERIAFRHGREALEVYLARGGTAALA
jgi:ADP-ribose pyrophosphatase YjhB (NUDIX family)